MILISANALLESNCPTFLSLPYGFILNVYPVVSALDELTKTEFTERFYSS